MNEGVNVALKLSQRHVSSCAAGTVFRGGSRTKVLAARLWLPPEQQGEKGPHAPFRHSPAQAGDSAPWGRRPAGREAESAGVRR